MPSAIKRFIGELEGPGHGTKERMQSLEARVLKEFDDWKALAGSIEIHGVQWEQVLGDSLKVEDGGWYFVVEVFYSASTKR